MDLEDMNVLRKGYIADKKTLLGFQRTLGELRSNLAKEKLFHNSQLKLKRDGMLGNKELRDSYDISNQKLWESKIKQLTMDEEIKINELTDNLEVDIKQLEVQIEDLKLNIESKKWELLINLEFNKTGMVV